MRPSPEVAQVCWVCGHTWPRPRPRRGELPSPLLCPLCEAPAKRSSAPTVGQIRGLLAVLYGDTRVRRDLGSPVDILLTYCIDRVDIAEWLDRAASDDHEAWQRDDADQQKAARAAAAAQRDGSLNARLDQLEREAVAALAHQRAEHLQRLQ